MGRFSKVLVANRGEIAVRIIRCLRDMGITSVAVYSTADSRALHVLMADEAYCIGPAEPLKSYLSIDAIIDVAKKADVDAIHPGYGFLSQNPDFVERVEEEGIKFIGPPAKVQRLTGDKVETKRCVSRFGVPIIPGSLDPVKSLDEALSIAKDVGFPVILKPRLGGGGIGMFICRSPDELRENFKHASRLAENAFGVAEIYVEKYFPKAKHIEVQILADEYGNMIHLFERECSVQRRFQKVLEEAPSPSISEDLRRKVTERALRAARAVGYVNAGTVEFLYVPGTEDFYFLEINSRIQVEHPVTEMITGVDIVEAQVRIAEGERLWIRQDDVRIRGHAIEARIYAEDPITQVPSPGRVRVYVVPKGPGVRVDDWIYPGCEIPPYYDPLIAKLIVWAENRFKAIKRLRRALREYVIEGVKTNIPLHLAILSHPEFISGRYTTRFLSDVKLEVKVSRQLKLPVKVSVGEEKLKERRVVVPAYSPWTIIGRYMELRDNMA